MQLYRTDSTHSDFIALVTLLDADLAVRNGDQNAFFAQHNKIDLLQHVVVLYIDEVPVACGAFKLFDADAVEMKRMYTKPDYRGQRLAEQVLVALEVWAGELGYQRCVLETGTMNPEAIRLYLRCGYEQIPNFGQYIGVADSRCFERRFASKDTKEPRRNS
jgi:putative acetyltransferase